MRNTMEATLNFNIPLTISQLADILKKQLPSQDRQKLAKLLQEDEPMDKEVLRSDLKEAIREVNLYKKGELKLRSAWEVLDEI